MKAVENTLSAWVFEINEKLTLAQASVNEAGQQSSERLYAARTLLAGRMRVNAYERWWARKDSNLRPMDYESTALTN
jgi:hypothetical protein